MNLWHPLLLFYDKLPSFTPTLRANTSTHSDEVLR